MMTMGQAARATGRSKPTIARAIKSGTLSAVRGVDGSYSIDPAELERVYRVTGNGDTQVRRSEPRDITGDAPGNESEHRDRLVQEQAETIRDLRHRLDRADEERRRAQEQLAGLQTQMAALLTDQRSTPPASAPPPPAPRRWWHWRRQG
jgi:hypothetical protein